MTKRLLFPASLLLPSIVLSGCLISGTIDANGAGTLTVRSRLTSPGLLDSSAQKMQSPHVRLLSATVDADKWATYKLEFDDVTQLSTTEYFEDATFALTSGKAGTKTLTVQFANKKPSQLSDELLDYLGRQATLQVHLPGPVVESNGAEVEGETVSWKYPIERLTSGGRIEMHATFGSEPQKNSAGSSGEHGTEPPSAPDPASAQK